MVCDFTTWFSAYLRGLWLTHVVKRFPMWFANDPRVEMSSVTHFCFRTQTRSGNAQVSRIQFAESRKFRGNFQHFILAALQTRGRRGN